MILDVVYVFIGLLALAMAGALIYPPVSTLFGRNNPLAQWRHEQQRYPRWLWLLLGCGLLLLAAGWLTRGLGGLLGLSDATARAVKDILQLLGIGVVMVVMFWPRRRGKR